MPFLQKLQGKALPSQNPAPKLFKEEQGKIAPEGQRRDRKGEKLQKEALILHFFRFSYTLLPMGIAARG
jgi:hypothetical protein